MQRKRHNVSVYTDDIVKLYTQLTIQVDDAGDKWLTPEQIDFLEFMHTWARYECINQLKASRPLVTHWRHPMLEVGASKSSDLGSSFARSTPAFSGVLP